MYHSHPDVNDFGTADWDGSRAQKAWAAVMDKDGKPYRSIQTGFTALKVHGQKIATVSDPSHTELNVINLSHLCSTLSTSEPPRIKARVRRDLDREDVAALLDTGATSHNFIDECLVNKLRLNTIDLFRNVQVTSIHNTTKVSYYVKFAFT